VRQLAALLVRVVRSILVEDATVRLTLTAPLTPSRGLLGWLLRPPSTDYCRLSSSSRPWTGASASAASPRGAPAPALARTTDDRRDSMANENAALIRGAYEGWKSYPPSA
jgi:hypothetical protein